MNVDLYECECMLDLHKLKLVLNILLVDCSAEYQHPQCAWEDNANVKYSVNIRYQGEFHINELEKLKQQDNRVEEVGAHESRTVDEDSIHVFPTQVHEAESNEEPTLQTLRATEVDGGENTVHGIQIGFERLN